MAIAGGSVRDDLGKSRFGIRVFAAFRERHRSLEGGAALGGFLCLPPLVTAPGRDNHHDENDRRDGVIAVTVPQLLELLSPDFLVDFLENV